MRAAPKGAIGQAAERARSTAADILASVDDMKTWVWIIATARKKGDTRTVLEALKYLTDRRDGKAPASVKLQPEQELIFGIGQIAEESLRELNSDGKAATA